MNLKPRLVIMFVMVFCLLITCIASAASCSKRLYIDGVFIDDSNAAAGLEFGYDRLTIGAGGNRYYLYNEYIGKMDEFAIYSGVLSDPCITAHYAAKDSNTAYTAAVSNDNPLLWLRFEDATTDNNYPAINAGWIGIDGNYITTGGSALTQTTGINAGSQCLVFPDTEANAPGHCVDVWDGNGDFGEDWDGDVTIELWVNFTDIGKAGEPENDYPRFFQHNGNYEVTESYGIVVQGPNTLGVLGGDEVASMGLSSDINDGQWHHVVVTYDSTYDEPNYPDTNAYAAEVAQDNPVLWLRFEDDLPEDSSVNNNWVGYGSAATIMGNVGGIGKSCRLDGTTGGGVYGVAATNNQDPPPLVEGSYAVFGDEYAFAPNDITFELWYRTFRAYESEAWPEDYGIFFQQIGTYENEPCAPGVSNATGNVRVFGGSDYWYTNVSAGFGNRLWHHMVVTYDEDYEGTPNSLHMQFYLDGELEGEATRTDAKLGPELSHIIVGAENDLGYTYNAFAGYVDEFAIYEGILSAERVGAHYAAWQPKTCEELVERGGLAPWTNADRDGNCVIDFTDFAIFAQEWALCNDPAGGEGCTPNW